MSFWHVPGNWQWTLHELVAEHVIGFWHAPGTEQKTLQSVPAQLMFPQPARPQMIWQLLAVVQSTPPAQAFAPVQVTWHGMPGGQVRPPTHGGVLPHSPLDRRPC
jgi:hypothetical protein